MSLLLRLLSQLIRDNQKQCIKYRTEAKAGPGAQNKVRSLRAREKFQIKAYEGTARQGYSVWLERVTI